MSLMFLDARKVLTAACLSGLALAGAHAQSYGKGDLISGEAKIVSGYAFDLHSRRIRLWGIDAPERGAWCYRNARKWKPADESSRALRRCVQNRVVTCRVVSTEREWFRTIHTSECWTDDGKDVGECLVRGGWATDYTCYSGGYYRDHETEAQNKGVGLWQCDTGPGTRRWGRNGRGATCDPPVYKPSGPGAS